MQLVPVPQELKTDPIIAVDDEVKHPRILLPPIKIEQKSHEPRLDQSPLKAEIARTTEQKPMYNAQTNLQTQQSNNHEEKHVNTGQYLKSGVYGGLDGLINTLSIILGGIGAAADSNHILLIAIAGLIGDGIAMGLGDYLSSKSENQFVQAERNRETWEAEYKREDELKEMQQLYMEKGYSMEDSRRLGELISKNTEAFVNIMMLEELGLVTDQGSPVLNGVVNFLSFVIFGFFPILPYCINKATHSKQSSILISSLVLGGFFLFFLGFLKAWLIGTNSIKSGLLTLTLGSAAVAVGYGIGVGVQ